MKRSFQNQVVEMFRGQDDGPSGDVITEGDITGLPEPVQRYLRSSKVIGKTRVQNVRLRQRGFIRMNPDQKWIPLTAEEYYTVDPPAFAWYGRAQIMPLVAFEAMDRLSDGRGHMLAKLVSLIKVVDATGMEMDQGAIMRFFSEMIWFPSALVSDAIHWEAIDAKSAKATFVHGGKPVSAEFHFDENGRVVNFVADRYRSVGKEFVLQRWSTPITEYAELNGLVVPVKGEAVWHLPTGDFSYIEVEITDLEYDNPEGYWQS